MLRSPSSSWLAVVPLLASCAVAESPTDPGSSDPSSDDHAAQVDVTYTTRIHKLPMLTPEQAQRTINQAASAHLTYYGGPVLQHVKIVQFNWSSSVNYISQLSAFYSAITNSTYFDWLSEYNTSSPSQVIGRGTLAATVTDTGAPTGSITDAQIQSEINKRITDGTLPAPDADTLYMTHFPPGVSITASDGSQSCVQFCAYHGTFVRNSQNIYYGVLPDLGGSCASGCGSSTQLNNTTSVSSHEMIEAVTDAAVGIATVIGPPLAWYDQTNGEIGDICNAQQGTVAGYTVQKEWSNAQGACVTGGGTTTSNDFTISASPTSGTVAAGSSISVTVKTTVAAGSAATVSLSASGLPSGVTASFNPSSVTAGGSSTLTLTASSTAAAATATVSIKGVEGSASHSATYALTVSSTAPPPPPPGSLTKDVPVTGLSGATGSSTRFTFDVPAGATNVKFTMSGGTGDADLYLKFGSAPTKTSYDYRPYLVGNNETVTYATGTQGTYYILIDGYAAFSGVSLVATYTVGTPPPPPPPGNVLTNGVPVTGLSGAYHSWQYFTITVPAGTTTLDFNISGGSGDADMYIRLGAKPTTTSWDYRPYLTGNNESVSIFMPTAGTYYVGIRGYAAYSGVSLVASYQ